MGCLSEDVVLAFIDGSLTAAAVADVDAHIAECASCLELVALASPAPLEPPPAVTTAAPAAAPLAPGASVGRYVILAPIGRGGMGEVYAAYDPQLDRKVAVKLLRGERDRGAHQAQNRARLLREAKAIARLSHPNVVVVHDAGTLDGSVFIAMEFVDGETLAAWRAAKPRSWREVRDVFVSAGRGLAAAHAAGLVHRDFKPHNVMIGRDGTVRVMDFGLAMAFGAASPGAPPETHTGETADGPDTSFVSTQSEALVGTPAYMAPEQFRGEPADARTDQFSFCVALYEALYGQRPFRGESLLALAASALSGQIDAPPAKSAVPQHLRRIVLRGLGPTREQRYPSMAELLRDLARDASRRRRLALAIAATALVAVGGTVGAVRARAAWGASICREGAARATEVWPAAPARQGQPLAGRPLAVRDAFARAGRSDVAETFVRVDRTLSRYVSRWIAAYGDACEATHVRHEQPAAVLDLRTACLGERLAGAHALTDALMLADAAVVDHAANAALQLPDLDRCSDPVLLRSTVPPPREPARRAAVEQLRARLAEVRLLASTGHFDASATQIHSLESAVRAADYPPLLTDFLLGRYESLSSGALTDRTDLLRQALRAAEASGYDEGAARALVDLVAADYRKGDVADVWSDQADAVVRHLGDPLMLRAWLEANAAVMLFGRGQPGRALERARRAIELKERRTPRDDSDIALTESDACMFLQQLDRFDEALAHCQRAVDLSVRELGWRHPTTMNLVENRAAVLAEIGRTDEAEADARRVLAFFHSIGEPTETRTSPLLTLGRCALARGNARAAGELLDKSLAAREEAQATPIELAEVEIALARASWESGDRARALSLGRRALQRYEAMPELSSRRARARAWLATVTVAGRAAPVLARP